MDWEKIYHVIQNEAFSIKYCIFMGIIRSISNEDLEYLLVEMECEKKERENKNDINTNWNNNIVN